MTWAIMLPKMLVDAWALWLLWAWFVVPLGAPRIGYWQAMGLDMFIGLFVLATVTKVEEDKDLRDALLLTKLVMVPIAVGMAWVVLQIWRAS